MANNVPSKTLQVIMEESEEVIRHLTMQEIEEFIEAFLLFDKDGDGTISLEELIPAMRALGQNPQIMEQIHEVDIDGDGLIEFPEFCCMMKKIMSGSEVDMLKEAFRVFDKDGNGCITAEEFKHFMIHMGMQFDEQEVAEFMDLLDVDKNGSIDYQEFLRIVL